MQYDMLVGISLLLTVTLADGAKTTSAYAVKQHDGEPMLETRVTDALGRQSESYTDEKGRKCETVQHADGEDVRVSYDYAPVGQVTTVHHPNGTQTIYTYDMFGRKSCHSRCISLLSVTVFLYYDKWKDKYGLFCIGKIYVKP